MSRRDRDDAALLLRSVRLVPVGRPAPPEPVDVRCAGGRVVEVAPTLRPRPDEEVVDAEGRWAIPGLWDQHVHLGQVARDAGRLDLRGCADAEAVTRLVAEHVAALPASRADEWVVGFGYRSAVWPRPPTVAELDAVSGDHPVALSSGDVHNGWLNSKALALLGLPPREGPLRDDEWYPVFARLSALTASDEAVVAGCRRVVAEAAARGVVGVVDMEFGGAWREWPARIAAGVDRLRVRASVYPEQLDEVIAAGLAGGDPLGEGDLGERSGLVVMGPLKVITDGALNTRSAWCFEPYADGGPDERGTLSWPPETLTGLLRRAAAHGLQVAVHAIGDAAAATALDAFAASGARGTIEHAQLLRLSDAPRMAELGVAASVQPAHLLDDRDVTFRCWPDRADRCFVFRTLLDAGVTLRFGSDAPVSPLDPWLAMAAAVHRSADERPPWNPAQALTAAEALAASTDGQRTLAPGAPADIVLLGADPLAPVGDSAAVAAHLRRMPVAATFLAGRATHLAL